MDWRHKALCRDEDPELFFPLGEEGPSAQQINDAKQICARCPALLQCRDWALKTGQEAGIWGGMTESERRKERAKQRSVRQHIHVT